ncbi:MAG: SymE family type I addiction module toxin [Lachnospiraceae bacterium]|nr:SymE family type I addiction module toxin [Lachnospiraceae bacterium]
MKSKKIKVIRSTKTRVNPDPRSCQFYVPTPKIQVEGYWLEALGFHIGDEVQVEYGEGIISFRPLPKEPTPSMVAETSRYSTSRKKSAKAK